MNQYVKSIKKRVRALTYFEHFLIFISVVSGCVLISEFVSLASILIGIISSTLGLNICAITAGITKYESIIKKTRKKTRHTVISKK